MVCIKPSYFKDWKSTNLKGKQVKAPTWSSFFSGIRCPEPPKFCLRDHIADVPSEVARQLCDWAQMKEINYFQGMQVTSECIAWYSRISMGCFHGAANVQWLVPWWGRDSPCCICSGECSAGPCKTLEAESMVLETRCCGVGLWRNGAAVLFEGVKVSCWRLCGTGQP